MKLSLIAPKTGFKKLDCSGFFDGQGYCGFLFGDRTITIRENGSLYDLIILKSWKEESWHGIDLLDIRRLLETELNISLPRGEWMEFIKIFLTVCWALFLVLFSVVLAVGLFGAFLWLFITRTLIVSIASFFIIAICLSIAEYKKEKNE